MTDDIKFNQKAVQQMADLLNGPEFDQMRRQQYAAQLRNDKTADWVSNFMNRMVSQNVPDHILNKETGQAHTVESMVASLKERVKLDSITKDAGLKDIPLTAKAIQKKKTDTELTDERKESISRFIDEFFSSHRGYADAPAVLYACREKFNKDMVSENIEFFLKFIQEAKEKNKSPGMSAILPSAYQGQPLKVDLQHDLFQPLFENIKNL